VTMNAINQTLPQLLERIARQVNIRWEVDGSNLSVMPDTAFLRAYKIDYVNISRTSASNVDVSTEVSAAGGRPGGAAGSGSNSSSTELRSTSGNFFWENLTQNLCAIVAATRVLSREQVEEQRQALQREREDRLNAASRISGAGAGAPQLMQQVLGASSATPLSTQQITCQTGGTAASPTGGGASAQQAASSALLTVNNPVIANRETGVIMVFANQSQHLKVREFIDRTSVQAVRQVLIEATVVEVQLSNQYQQGINWQRLRSTGDGFSITQQPTGPGALPGGASPGVAATAAGNAITPGLANPGSVTSGLLQLTYLNPDSRIGNIAAALTLLESFGTVRVLSSPKLSVLNNQTAILKVVDNLVYFTVSVTPTTTTNIVGGVQVTTVTNTFSSTPNTVPVGFVMSVTPQIAETDVVAMNVRPTISRVLRYVRDPNPDLARANVTNLVPEIQTREMESILRVPHNTIAVMGGLMQDSTNNAEDGIPGANRIPIFGELFKYRNDQARKSELVIFLRPVVIRDPSIEADYKAFREFLPGDDFFKRRNSLQPDPIKIDLGGAKPSAEPRASAAQ
jgi:MSHA biogenesis protein MshL